MDSMVAQHKNTFIFECKFQSVCNLSLSLFPPVGVYGLTLRSFLLDEESSGLPLVANEISPQAMWEAGRAKLLSKQANYGSPK